MNNKVAAGSKFPPLNVKNIHGAPVNVPDMGWTHLQFRRYAGCPICNLHLQPFIKRHRELADAGIHEVIVFHSNEKDLLPYQGSFPFDVVGDPDKILYRRYGVETSFRSVFDPRAWPAAIRGSMMKDKPTTGKGVRSGLFGLPADFLVSPGGVAEAVHYGTNAFDQWSFGDVLAKYCALKGE